MVKEFLIITKYGSYKVHVADFEEAVYQAYNIHTGYADVIAIISTEEY